MHDFCFHHLEWYPQRYPQTFWLPSDVPGFDGGVDTPVVPFLRFLVVTQNQADWAHRGGMLEPRLAMQTDAPAVATTDQSTLGRICPVPADRLSLLDDRHHGLFTLVRRIAVFAEQSLHLAPHVRSHRFLLGPVDGD